MSRKLLRDYVALLVGLQSPVKWYNFFNGLSLGPSSKGEHHVLYKLWFHKNNAEQVSTSGNVRAFFTSKEKPSEDNVKWRVMAADVKMCEMITELNLPLATADSLRNILIGRELTNFHYYCYYGFVVSACCVALTAPVAWTLSWNLKVVPTNKT